MFKSFSKRPLNPDDKLEYPPRNISSNTTNIPLIPYFSRKKGKKSKEPQPPRTLSSEQTSIVSACMNGESLFYTGDAGTGKTELLLHIIKKLRYKHGKYKVYVCAPTGIAACKVKGTTLHSFAGVGFVLKKSVEDLVKQMNAGAKKRWREVEVIVIDECLS
jgi:ATP-dependent DNA helicase PIF1